MFKKILLLIVLLVSMNTTVLAAAKIEQNTASGLSLTTVIVKEIQMVTDMFAGFDSVNYEKFSKDFSDELKTVFTPVVFKNAHQDTISKLGEFGGMNILIWQAGEGDMVDVIIYRGAFAKDDAVLITVRLDRSNPAMIKIKQVSFESPLMQ